MSSIPVKPTKRHWLDSRIASGIVLTLALVTTAYAFWRERELVQRDQVIRWQAAFARLTPVLNPLLANSFESLRYAGYGTVNRDGPTATAWKNFLGASEWQHRFPGMMEIGLAEPILKGGRLQTCRVKFIESKNSNFIHKSGFDWAAEKPMREALEKSTVSGYGFAIPELRTGLSDSNLNTKIELCFLPIRLPSSSSIADKEHPRWEGIIFFSLDQGEYFRSLQPTLATLPFKLKLLPDKTDLPIDASRERDFTIKTLSGTWNFLLILPPQPIQMRLTPWFNLVVGLAVSLLLWLLFGTQAQLRNKAEASNEQVLARDSEIRSFSRDLEKRIAARTVQLRKSNEELTEQIAERQKAEARLKEALAAEKDLNQLKSNFISMVSHEIRTPLAIILSSSETLSRYLDRLAPEKREGHLHNINESVQRMSALMEDVLLFSRAEAGKIEFTPAPLNLTNFCQCLVAEIASTTGPRCPLELELAEFNEMGRGDETLLRHILNNLLTNAAKYSTAGASVKFRVTRVEGDAIFEVEDSGIGIPEEDRPRLFTPFFRGANAAHINGSGLGLIIVRRCVERHGGTLGIESREGIGTTVTVRLPMFSPAHTEFLKRFE